MKGMPSGIGFFVPEARPRWFLFGEEYGKAVYIAQWCSQDKNGVTVRFPRNDCPVFIPWPTFHKRFKREVKRPTCL